MISHENSHSSQQNPSSPSLFYPRLRTSRGDQKNRYPMPDTIEVRFWRASSTGGVDGERIKRWWKCGEIMKKNAYFWWIFGVKWHMFWRYLGWIIRIMSGCYSNLPQRKKRLAERTTNDDGIIPWRNWWRQDDTQVPAWLPLTWHALNCGIVMYRNV